MVYRVKWYNTRAQKAGASIVHTNSAMAAARIASNGLGADYEIDSVEFEDGQSSESLLNTAAQLIRRGVELMTVEQLSQWEGVRAWQEVAETHVTTQHHLTDSP